MRIVSMEFSLSPIKILPFGEIYDFTTGDTECEPPRTPIDGGMLAKISAEFESGANGKILVYQVVKRHKLNIDRKDGTSHTFEDGPFRDASSNIFPHFKLFSVKNGHLATPAGFRSLDPLEVFDAPHWGLASNFTRIEYYIEFVTSIFYKDENVSDIDEPSMPVHLKSFEWFLDAEAVEDGDSWQLTKSQASTSAEIEISMTESEPPFSIDEVENMSTIRNALKEKGFPIV